MGFLMADFENKLVVVINEKIETGKAMNALSHAMLGFGAGVVTKEEVHLNQYEDSERNKHENISEMPIMVLKTRPNKIRELRKAALENSLRFIDFVDTMSIGTYEEEYALTKTKKDEELTYWAIILFGPWDLVTNLTRKFSLYK